MRALELNPNRHFAPAISTLKFTVTRFDGFMAALLFALMFVEIVLARRVRLQGPAHTFALLPWFEIAFMGAAIAFHHWRPCPRLIHAADLLLWSGLFANPISMLMQIAARSHFGLVDAQLAAIDGRMHFNTASIHLWIARSPFLSTCSILTYVLFIPLIYLAVLVPCLCGHAAASRRFVVGVIIAMVLGSALFVYVPAAGPWTSESMRPSALQSLMTDYLLRLKVGLPIRAEMAHAAIVSFPSEHVVVCVLAARALGAVKSIRAPVWILCILVCCSTITTGWHYGIDVLGGLIVAYVSSVLADRLCTICEVRDEIAST